MKRLILFMIGSGLAFAALNSTIVYEVRPTVGSDSNGGCFDSAGTGTDYSQQNSAQYNFTDLVIGATTTNVSSASHSFVAADVGNCIDISAGTGFTTGWYEVISVAGGVATLDRSAGTAASSGGTWFEGGALATVSQANSTAKASNTVWVKATGTYTVTSAMTINLNSSASTSETPYSIIGYSSSRGDNGKFTWTTSTNSIDLIDFTGATLVKLQNINFTTSAGTKGNGIQASASGNSTYVWVINCVFNGFAVGILGNYNVNYSFQPLFFINSRVTGSVSQGIYNSSPVYIIGSMIDNNGGDGAAVSGGSAPSGGEWTIEHSVFYKNGGNGITLRSGFGATLVVIDESDFSTNTGSGVASDNGSAPGMAISNSIFDANGAYGISASAGTIKPSWNLYNNAFYNNTSGQMQNISNAISANAITLTASPYTTIGSDFSLNNTSGGGAALKGAGFPGAIPNGGSGHISVGALQPAAGGGSSGPVGFPIVQ